MKPGLEAMEFKKEISSWKVLAVMISMIAVLLTAVIIIIMLLFLALKHWYISVPTLMVLYIIKR